MNRLMLLTARLLASFNLWLLAPLGQAEMVIPVEKMERWLHFSRADLDKIAVEQGQLDFSSRFVYDGEQALRWRYAPGGRLTWNCHTNKLGESPTVYFTALEPQVPDKSPSAFRIEFLDGAGKVAGACEMPLARPSWNRCIIRLAPNNGFQVGIRNMAGVVPNAVSAVRITPLRKEPGEVFLGGWILTGEWMLNRGDTAEVDGFPETSPPDVARLPEPSATELSPRRPLWSRCADAGRRIMPRRRLTQDPEKRRLPYAARTA